MLVVEEGYPDYIEQAVNVELRRADIQTRVLGKGPLPQAGEYTSDVLLEGLAAFLQAAKPHGIDADTVAEKARGLIAHKAESRCRARAAAAAPAGLLHRLPGAPGVLRHQADAARTGADPHQRRYRLPFVRDLRAVQPRQFDPRLRHVARQRRGGRTRTWTQRPIAIMGDGGFWHNGLITGVASNLFNKGDGVLIVMQNGYASATGQQYIPSSTTSRDGADARHGYRADAALDGREMAAHGAHL